MVIFVGLKITHLLEMRFLKHPVWSLIPYYYFGTDPNLVIISSWTTSPFPTNDSIELKLESGRHMDPTKMEKSKSCKLPTNIKNSKNLGFVHSPFLHSTYSVQKDQCNIVIKSPLVVFRMINVSFYFSLNRSDVSWIVSSCSDYQAISR